VKPRLVIVNRTIPLSMLDWLIPLQIDVQDLAAAHLATLTSPAARNKRFIVGHPISFRTIVDTLRGVPELEGRLPKDSNEEPTYPRLDTEPARKALDMQYRSAEDTFVGLAKKILALEEKLGKE
jgi:nucleoside-diphosphate-sugar epimerase